MGFKPNPETTPSATAEELISKLRSSFFSLEFQFVAKTLMEREQKMEEECLKLKRKVEEERSLLVMEILKVKDELKKKEDEVEVLRKAKDEFERKVRVLEQRCFDLDQNVLSLEKMVKEHKKIDHVVESCRPPLFSEKEDCKSRTEPNLPVIIEIDDDDGDGVNQRKRSTNEIKRDYNAEDDDDDVKFISTVKRPRSTNEIKEELHVKSAKISPFLKKINLHSSVSDPGSDIDEAINKAYMASVAKTKKQKERWEGESDVKGDLEKDDELCLNGVCALYRRRTIVHGTDISSLSNLACMLIDGDPQKKLTKKASELSRSDIGQCRMFAKKYAMQLFNIYQEKSDPFFPSSRSEE